ncbi:hypothetical protein [Nocardia spumae]|uniref:hypothetical protein n=1 Tax=Nocardia spumae TaxID=2887190 RepID=UPI001D143A9D|nr:hypothetical protein [Nocardia spumae]
MGLQSLTQVDVNYSDDLSDDMRREIDKSIAALIDRSNRAAERRRAVQQERVLLREAKKDSFRKLFGSDGQAAYTSHTTAKEQSAKSESLELPIPPAIDSDELSKAAALRFGLVTKLFQPPFYFDWKWDNSHGTYGLSYTSDKSGVAAINAEVKEDGAFINAHAGVGVALTTETLGSSNDVYVLGRALTWTNRSWFCLAGLQGGDATTEGGTELTVLSDGELITSKPETIWRSRLSDGEYDQFYDPEGPFEVGNPYEVLWTMHPGKVYTFNLGAWVYVECNEGIFGYFSHAVGSNVTKIGALSLFK